MGYNVTIKKSNLVIPLVVQDQVLRIWKSINHPQYDKLKRGGSFNIGGKSKSWYSWMDEKYDENVTSCQDVLDMLGFYYTIDDKGDIHVDEYDNKTGQEDLFFIAIAHLLPDSEIKWFGEDYESWYWKFKDGVLYYDNEKMDNPFLLKVQQPVLSSTQLLQVENHDKHLLFKKTMEAERAKVDKISDPTLNRAYHLALDGVILQYITIMIDDKQFEDSFKNADEVEEFRNWYKSQLTRVEKSV